VPENARFGKGGVPMENRWDSGRDAELRMIRDARMPERYKRDLEEFLRASRKQLRERIEMMIHFAERQERSQGNRE
jgi:hypothetical protein